MGFLDKLFVEVRNGSKVTYSESDLSKLDRTYENEVIDKKEKKVMSPFKKESQRSFQSQVRDYAFERILDRHLYTFSHLLVIPNPYGVAKQTALLLFNSSKETKVVYKVMGDSPENDFNGETEYTKRHRVPILGLYQNRNNKVDLKLIDTEGKVIKHRVLTIYVSAVQKNITDIVGEIKPALSHFPFILLNGINYNPFAIDRNGDIRYSLQCKTGRLGMIPLQNQRFLLMDKTANIVNEFGEIQPCRYQEMDYMGRVYHTFLLEYQIGRAIAQDGDFLFLVTSSDKEHILDKIVELDMNSGEIIKSCDLKELLGDKYRVNSDWANISHIEYKNGYMMITARKLHSVIRCRWDDIKIDWIFAPSSVWKDTELEKYVLKSDGEEIVCSCPEFVLSEDGTESNQIIIFEDNRKVGVQLDKKSYKTSYARIISIDENGKTYTSVNNIPLKKAICYGKIIRSEEGCYMLACQGSLKEKTDDISAMLTEFNAADGKECGHVNIKKSFSSAWIFKPDIKDYCHSMEVNDKVLFGNLKAPDKFNGEIPPVCSDKIEKSIFGRVVLCDDLMICTFKPGFVDRIYLIGENNAYVKDYSVLEELNRKEFFAIPLNDIAIDEYHVYVEYDGECYKLKNEIRVVK